MRRGAAILGRNLRTPQGEIDLLVGWHGERVAVEVRCRRGADPVQEISDRKVETVARAARAAGAGRVDLVAVRLDRLGATVRWIPSVA